MKPTIFKLIRFNKNELNVTKGLNYPIAVVDNHSSDIALNLLKRHSIDFIFISKAGIIKKNIIENSWQIINCHPGILPRYRGIGSCEWAVYENGPLGVTAHYVDRGIDTGSIIYRKVMEPRSGETLREFRFRLDKVGAQIFALIAYQMTESIELNAEFQDPNIGVLYTRKPALMEMQFIEKAFQRRRSICTK